MDKESVEALEEHLDGLIETSRQLGIMAADFQQQSQSSFNQKFIALGNFLKNIDKMKDSFAEVKVPVSVFNYIDEGKNPLLYTKDCLMKTLKKNEEIKGKIVTIKTFRDLLLEELNKNFPEDYDAYVKIRQAEAAEAEAEANAQATHSEMIDEFNQPDIKKE
ncbi:unnamed protein product [Brachionus calyciflorus]|uniref:Mediator of RNA polymerase II transcription subunit 10 n=1 Tax=Brachionus calyciflorus TaxID=104777 RepID=A0A813NQJ5_9BILA|nr:unnamed protein product [Brachionus calyciflorus]